MQPVEELVSIGAEHAHLREVNVSVDEARQDEPVLDVGRSHAGVAFRHVGERTEVGDQPVLDDEKPVVEETSGLGLVADVIPRVIHEIEERAPDRTAGTPHFGLPCSVEPVGRSPQTHRLDERLRAGAPPGHPSPPDNRSLRLAIIIDARTHGIDIDEQDLDALHDAIDPANPDLAPLLDRGLERLTAQYQGAGQALEILRRLAP